MGSMDLGRKKEMARLPHLRQEADFRETDDFPWISWRPQRFPSPRDRCSLKIDTGQEIYRFSFLW